MSSVQKWTKAYAAFSTLCPQYACFRDADALKYRWESLSKGVKRICDHERKTGAAPYKTLGVAERKQLALPNWPDELEQVMKSAIGLQHKVNPPFVLEDGGQVCFAKRTSKELDPPECKTPFGDATNVDTTGKRAKQGRRESLVVFMQQQAKVDEEVQMKLCAVLDRFLNGNASKTGVAPQEPSRPMFEPVETATIPRPHVQGQKLLDAMAERLQTLRVEFPERVFRILVEVFSPTYTFTQHDVPMFFRIARGGSKTALAGFFHNVETNIITLDGLCLMNVVSFLDMLLSMFMEESCVAKVLWASGDFRTTLGEPGHEDSEPFLCFTVANVLGPADPLLL